MRDMRSMPWRAWLQIACWRHGHAWLLALACNLAAAVLHFGVEPAAQAKLRMLGERLARAQATPARTVSPVATPDGGQALRALLARPASLDERLRAMAVVAQAQGLALPRADYQLQHLPGGLRRWQVTQPLSGSYAQLRAYAEAVLRAQPDLSLDEMALRRDNAGQPVLQAQLRWSLWSLEGGAPPAGTAAALPWLMPREQLFANHSARGPAADLFGARQWIAPAASTPAIVASAAPTAPPLPFTYLGMQQEEGRWTVFAAHDASTLMLREGEVVEGQWRVERIAPPRLSLLHLPTGEARELAIGEAR